MKKRQKKVAPLILLEKCHFSRATFQRAAPGGLPILQQSMARIFTVERGLFTGGWGDHRGGVAAVGVCEHSDMSLEKIVAERTILLR